MNTDSLFKIFKTLPWKGLDALARLTSSFVYPLLSTRRQIASKNLDIVFKNQLETSEKSRVLRTNLYLFIRNILEIGKIASNPKEDWLKKWQIIGEEHLKAAYMKGRGVILVSAHMGNFPLLCCLLAFKGYDIAAVAKIPTKGIGAQAIEYLSQTFGIKFIHARENKKAAMASVRYLKKGGILFIQVDQNAPQHKAMIPFFGHQVPVPRSPAILAKRLQAAIVPVMAIDLKDFRHKVFFEPELDTNQSEGQILRHTQSIIEKYVMAFPEQWFWWHRRFKEHGVYGRQRGFKT